MIFFKKTKNRIPKVFEDFEEIYIIKKCLVLNYC